MEVIETKSKFGILFKCQIMSPGALFRRVCSIDLDQTGA